MGIDRLLVLRAVLEFRAVSEQMQRVPVYLAAEDTSLFQPLLSPRAGDAVR
jgi:hypothetical protein